MSRAVCLSRIACAPGNQARFHQGAAVCRWLRQLECFVNNNQDYQNTLIENYARKVIDPAGRHFTAFYQEPLKVAVGSGDDIQTSNFWPGRPTTGFQMCKKEERVYTRLYFSSPRGRIHHDPRLHAQLSANWRTDWVCERYIVSVAS